MEDDGGSRSKAELLATAWEAAVQLAAEIPAPEDFGGLRLLEAAQPSLIEALCAQFPQFQPQETPSATIRAGLQCWSAATMRQRLLALVRVTKRLDPLLAACDRKLNALDQYGRDSPHDEERDAVTLEDLINYGRLVASHVRAPPEYSDPTGTDPYCVPGFLYPCPDRLTMSRSALFYATLVRALPPTVRYEEDARSRQILHVELTTQTENAIIYYTINNTTQWAKYDSSARFFVTGPGKYVIRSYCQCEGQLPSEVTLSEVEVPGPDGVPPPAKKETTGSPSDAGEPTKTAAGGASAAGGAATAAAAAATTAAESAAVKSSAVASSKFGGLFLGGDDDDSDDSSEESVE